MMNNPLARLALAVSGALLLAGCATDRSFGQAPSIEVATLEQLPVPNTTTPYLIGALEEIQVTVAGSEMLSGSYLTDAQGAINFPLIGRVELAGANISEAGQVIANRLRGTYVLDPYVRIQPKSLPPQTISIGGQVKTPGAYPAVTSPTLLRAVNNAGGLAEYAKHDDVLVMRTVNGQRYIGVYNIQAIQRGNYDDPAIYPNDVVTVGDSPGRRQLDRILQLVPALTSTVLLVDRI